MYMIKLVWEKGKAIKEHGIVVVPKLPDKHVTKWLVEDVIIYLDDRPVKNADLIAEKRSGERWFADPASFTWKKLRLSNHK